VWTTRARRSLAVAWTWIAPFRQGLRRAWTNWSHFAEALAFAWILLFFNVFGQVTAVEHYGYELFNQLFAPEPSVYGEGAQANIVVLLYRDEDLSGDSWPVPYAKHAEHLARVLAGNPRAVMIDFVFVDPRKDSTIVDLRHVLLAFQSAHIPVFLASPHEETPAAPDLRPELRGPFAMPVPVPGLVGSASGSGYPLFVVGPERQRKPTAAMAMYEALCNRDRSPKMLSLCKPRNGARILSRGEAGWTLELFWGMKPPPNMSKVSCRPIPGFLGRLWAILWSRGEGFRVDCAFTPTVMVGELPPLENKQWLKDHFEDKVVYYGASFLAGSDIVSPPTQFSLPGVYAHTMAMDNLLTFGNAYKRDARESPIRLAPGWLVELVRGSERLPAHDRVESLVRCFRDEFTPHCAQYGLLLLVLLYIHIVSSVGAILFDEDRFAAMPRRGRRALARLLFGTWTIALSIVVPLVLVLWFALEVEFKWLNLAAGNWLEALLEAWAGHQWGPPLVSFVLSFVRDRPRIQGGDR
jgi:hypothetical protein